MLVQTNRNKGAGNIRFVQALFDSSGEVRETEAAGQVGPRF